MTTLALLLLVLIPTLVTLGDMTRGLILDSIIDALYSLVAEGNEVVEP